MTDRDQLRLPLDEAALRAAAIDGGYWRQLDVVEETGSTNADLLARAAAGGDIDGAVLIAEHQTAGRGRHGRGWAASPRAQITMSIGVRVDDVPVASWGWLSLAAGLAVVDSVAMLSTVEAGLKWPNDVLAGGGKLAGILAEVGQPFAVVGLGLNVTQTSEEAGAPGATSLLDEGVPAPDRDLLIRRLLRELAERITQWRRADPQLATDYRVRSLTLGSRVRAELPGGQVVIGIARDIDEQGRLCLDTGEGSSVKSVVISAGDVVHLRS
ncbi:biotin--[acetyl-CoA-carboxylase] ligase [Mycobacterium angelicum]|uniref:biotin--[biotin carboxyl-carrier protein] ligase n=1 Tax=Mycobacterium angelicum TaxID=470074 RepID=A0A1X0A9C7_MYCAN|nr:biotin--[acetyl-CoA-carboxylase] ligase [Mycobacterium angelicum]MCV7197655.1 biotin--[acetyl-CoA-carboxylase] ligase [Mycobacterium angelicum]ORA26525.1 biotin--[acetyl-CoA-carboxylase] ligase [Mycobacterium angelicum]